MIDRRRFLRGGLFGLGAIALRAALPKAKSTLVKAEPIKGEALNKAVPAPTAWQIVSVPSVTLPGPSLPMTVTITSVGNSSRWWVTDVSASPSPLAHLRLSQGGLAGSAGA